MSNFEIRFTDAIRPYFNPNKLVDIATAPSGINGNVTNLMAAVEIKGSDVRRFIDAPELLIEVNGEVTNDDGQRFIIAGTFEGVDCQIVATASPSSAV